MIRLVNACDKKAGSAVCTEPWRVVNQNNMQVVAQILVIDSAAFVIKFSDTFEIFDVKVLRKLVKCQAVVVIVTSRSDVSVQFQILWRSSNFHADLLLPYVSIT